MTTTTTNTIELLNIRQAGGSTLTCSRHYQGTQFVGTWRGAVHGSYGTFQIGGHIGVERGHPGCFRRWATDTGFAFSEAQHHVLDRVAVGKLFEWRPEPEAVPHWHTYTEAERPFQARLRQLTMNGQEVRVLRTEQIGSRRFRVTFRVWE